MTDDRDAAGSHPHDDAGADHVDEAADAGSGGGTGAFGMPATTVHGPSGGESDHVDVADAPGAVRDGDTDEWLDEEHHDASTLFHESEPPRPGGAKRRRIVLGAAVLVVLAGLVLAFTMIAPIVSDLTASKDFDGPGSGSATVVVNPGDSGLAIGQTLQEAGVVKTVEAFAEALQDTPGDEIQPGSYTLMKEMKASDAVTALRERTSLNQTQVTIREGLRATEIFGLLSKATGVPLAEYEAAAKTPDELGLPEAAGGEIEGYLFPATYTFNPDTSAVDQLTALVSQATGRWSALGVEPDTMQDTITIASIVEAEARLPQDRPKVAAVIENRLRIGMALQMDSTVAYGVGKRALTTTDQERANDNPYNTYLHPGLPAGPINNPGAEAVKATLEPAAGKWLYFVTVNPQTGETKFAETHAEHQRNVQEFQAWCQANPGTC